MKKLLSSEKQEQLFRRELSNLKKVSSIAHNHLIKLLATYETNGSYSFIFPWANGDLRWFWKSSPKPAMNQTDALWMAKQCHGLASGLMQIHNYNIKEDSGKGKGERFCGRHGDIKPENILWFEDSKTSRGILKIADLGIAEFVKKDSRPLRATARNRECLQTGNSESSGFKLQGFSKTYRAPECDLGKPVGRAYDIWSLGCVFLEFAIWMRLGHSALDTFANVRASAVPNDRIPDDAFFETFASDPGGKPQAKVKSYVSKVK